MKFEQGTSIMDYQSRNAKIQQQHNQQQQNQFQSNFPISNSIKIPTTNFNQNQHQKINQQQMDIDMMSTDFSPSNSQTQQKSNSITSGNASSDLAAQLIDQSEIRGFVRRVEESHAHFGTTPVAQTGGDHMMIQKNDENENDVLEASWLLLHIQNVCENCGETRTSQWRKGWWLSSLGRTCFLCNACGLKYHKNQFCPYCYYVYTKDEKFDQNHEWLTCRVCRRCTHIGCELQNRQGMVDENSYVCPDCVTDILPSKHSSHHH